MGWMPYISSNKLCTTDCLNNIPVLPGSSKSISKYIFKNVMIESEIRGNCVACLNVEC